MKPSTTALTVATALASLLGQSSCVPEPLDDSNLTCVYGPPEYFEQPAEEAGQGQEQAGIEGTEGGENDATETAATEAETTDPTMTLPDWLDPTDEDPLTDYVCVYGPPDFFYSEADGLSNQG